MTKKEQVAFYSNYTLNLNYHHPNNSSIHAPYTMTNATNATIMEEVVVSSTTTASSTFTASTAFSVMSTIAIAAVVGATTIVASRSSAANCCS